MMKIYIWLALAVVLIAGLCIYSLSYIDGTVSAVEKGLVGLSESVESNDWQNASAIYDESEKYWDQKNDLLHVFIEHRELEEINIVFKRLGYQVKSQNLYETEISLVELTHYLSQLKENQAFLFGNVF